MPKALKDLQRIITWYGYKSFRCVDRFLEEIRIYVDTITLHPEYFKAVIPGVQRCLLSQFPYVIYFTFTDTDIVMLRVRHKRQKLLRRYR